MFHLVQTTEILATGDNAAAASMFQLIEEKLAQVKQPTEWAQQFTKRVKQKAKVIKDNPEKKYESPYL